MTKTEWKTLMAEIQEKDPEISKGDIKKAIKKAYRKAAKSRNKFNNYKMLDLEWRDLPIIDVRELVDKYMKFDKEEDITIQQVAHLAPTQRTSGDTTPIIDITEDVEKRLSREELSYEEELKQRIDNHEPLTGTELKSLLEFEIDREEGDSLRWTRSVSSIIELCGETYKLDWFEGLTEMQEDEFYDQPYRVRKQEITKMITVTEWIRNDYDFEEEQEDEMDLE